MAKEAKLVDDEYKKVVITQRTDFIDSPQVFVGGSIIRNGKMEVVHYRAKLNEEVELPVPFIEQLRERGIIVQDRDGNNRKQLLYFVEEV